jgi:23S rRNA maturation mini-RNase III
VRKLRHCCQRYIGDDCLKFYNNLPLTENERNLTPNVNVIHERAKFMVKKQEQTKNADEYLNRLREELPIW